MGFRTWLRLYVIHKVWHPAMNCFLEIKINLSVYVITNLPHQNLSQIHLISKANKEILLNNLHLKEKKRERKTERDRNNCLTPGLFDLQVSRHYMYVSILNRYSPVSL